MGEQRVWTACGKLAAVFVMGVAVTASAQGPGPGSLVQPSAAVAAQAAAAVRPLSLDDAVKLALENNLGLQVQRITPQVQDAAITLSRSVWTPTLSGSMSTSKRNSPVSSFFSGAQDKLVNDSFSSEVSASQLLEKGGGNASVTWDTSRTKSNSAYNSPNPSLGANLTFSFTQPLLKNFKIDSSRQQLIVSKANRDISDFDLRQSVLTTVRTVKYAYWNLKAAHNSLAVAKQSLDLAKESLRNNRTRVDVGTMAPIDIVEAEAEVARREEAVIVAEGTVARAADSLRTLIFAQDMPDFWKVAIDPTEPAVQERRVVETEAAVKTALEKRTDLQAARKNLDVANSNITYYHNQSLPDLSAVLSYGQSGQGGTKKNFGSGFPPEVLDQIEEGYGKTLSRMIKPDYNNWSIGLQVTYPLGTSSAEANAARSKLLKHQQELQLRQLELQVTTSVRDVARQVDTNWKRYEATVATRKLMERRLQSEQKKFAAGLSTNYLVFQAQRDLADAQYSELVATLDYNKSLVDFETVQESPTAGSSSVAIQ
jgi:outer membrane protein